MHLERLKVNTQQTKYMVMSCHQNKRQNHNLLTANKSFERMARFKPLETAVTDKSYIHEEIKSRLNSGNACYHSLQGILSSSLTYKN
jgi:hypothetical protein